MASVEQQNFFSGFYCRRKILFLNINNYIKLIFCLEEAKVVAINDPEMTCEEIVHFLRYDSEYGQFMEQMEVKSSGGEKIDKILIFTIRYLKTNLLLETI